MNSPLPTPRPSLSGAHVLITGGAGFIGSALTAELVENNKVTILDNFHRDAISGTSFASHPNLEIIRGDVLDRHSVDRAMAKATHVVHLAAIAGVDTVLKRPTLTMRVNIIGSYNVLESAANSGKIERFIDFSTSEVFGAHAYKVHEGEATVLGAVGEARWTYAVSKLATEHMAITYFKEFGLPACSIRPFNIYGPRQVGEGAIHHFIVRSLKSEGVTIHNDGSQIRAWCYVDDIVDGIFRCLTNDKAPGHAFNIGNPRSTLTIHRLARLIVQLTGSKSELNFVRWDHPDVELRIPNIDKARTLLGFEPKIELEEGLSRTIDWYRKHHGL